MRKNERICKLIFTTHVPSENYHSHQSIFVNFLNILLSVNCSVFVFLVIEETAYPLYSPVPTVWQTVSEAGL